jgi:hypothetical protein
MSSSREKTMTPLETLPALIPGHITLVFPTVILTVPFTFINDVKLAAKGEDPELKSIAEEIIEETSKETHADPNLITHLVHAFMAMKMKLNPPPVQLDLFDDEEFIQDLPPEIKNIEGLMDVIRDNADEMNKEALEKLIAAPKEYREEKEKARAIMASLGVFNPLRGLTWLALVTGLGLWLGFNWADAHWGLVAAEVLLLIFYKQILFDHPGENNNGDQSL